MTPHLPCPDYGYISEGPWWVCFDKTGTSSVLLRDLNEAIRAWWEPAFGHPSSPDRRIVRDSNDVIILGAMSSLATMIATSEVLDCLEPLIGNDLATTMRMEILWDLAM